MVSLRFAVNTSIDKCLIFRILRQYFYHAINGLFIGTIQRQYFKNVGAKKTKTKTRKGVGEGQVKEGEEEKKKEEDEMWVEVITG